MSGHSPDWEHFQSGLFSPDLSDVVMISGEAGQPGAGPQLVRRKVAMAEEADNQVSIVLTRGRVRPEQILAWDQENDTMWVWDKVLSADRPEYMNNTIINLTVTPQPWKILRQRNASMSKIIINMMELSFFMQMPTGSFYVHTTTYLARKTKYIISSPFHNYVLITKI